MNKHKESPNLATDIFIMLKRRNKALKVLLLISIIANTVLTIIVFH